MWLLDLDTTTERLTLADAYFSSTNEYYFERPPSLFHIVYQFYLTGTTGFRCFPVVGRRRSPLISGQIHQPSHLCPTDILDELDYWGIVPDSYLAPCCCADDKVPKKYCVLRISAR